MDLTKHENVVDEWLAAFAAALDQRNIDRVLDLFEPKAFWRDLATFTWNPVAFAPLPAGDPARALGVGAMFALISKEPFNA